MKDIDITNPKNLPLIKRMCEITEENWKRLKIGMIFMEEEIQDPFGGSYFKHEVISIDLENRTYDALDHSLTGNSIYDKKYRIKTHTSLPDYVGMTNDEVFKNMKEHNRFETKLPTSI